MTYLKANRIRLSLKMKLSQYWWYGSSMIVSEKDGFSIAILVKKIDNQVRKLIPPVIDGVSIRTSLE